MTDCAVAVPGHPHSGFSFLRVSWTSNDLSLILSCLFCYCLSVSRCVTLTTPHDLRLLAGTYVVPAYLRLTYFLTLMTTPFHPSEVRTLPTGCACTGGCLWALPDSAPAEELKGLVPMEGPSVRADAQEVRSKRRCGSWKALKHKVCVWARSGKVRSPVSAATGEKGRGYGRCQVMRA